MNSQARSWTWETFCQWAFGPQVLVQMATLAADARMRLAFLREVDHDPAAVSTLKHFAREIRDRASGRRWDDEAAAADTILWQLNAGPPTTAALDRMEHACAGLERSLAARARSMAA
ncbi:MAG: hypothetical protein ACREN5_17270 [Gemmatimonadales bacterium]